MKTLLGLRITLYSFLILTFIALIAYDFLPVVDLFYIDGKHIEVTRKVYFGITSDYDIYFVFFIVKFLSTIVFLAFVMISLISPDILFKKYSSEFYLKLSGIITIIIFILIQSIILDSLSTRSFRDPYTDYDFEYCRKIYAPFIILILFSIIYSILEIFFNKLLNLVKINEKEFSYYAKQETTTTTPTIEQSIINEPKKVNLNCNYELQNIEFLQKYKELLDNGVITQEEFEDKKKSLL